MYKVSIPMDVCVFLQSSVRFRDREKAYHVVTVNTALPSSSFLPLRRADSVRSYKYHFKSHEDSRNS